jgi:RHS repeat-associated protein
MVGGGSVRERYEYDAYGKVTIWDDIFSSTRTTSAYNNDYFFTGRRTDTLNSDSFKIQYSRNRYYDTDTGRFLQQDPLGITPNPQKPNEFKPEKQYTDGMNVYEYAASNSSMNSDPYGLLIEQYTQPFPKGPLQGILHVGFLVDGDDWDFGPKDVESPGFPFIPVEGQSPWDLNDDWTDPKTASTLTIKKTGRLRAGPKLMTSCCKATESDVKACIFAESKRFNDHVLYWFPWPNCRTFLDDTKSKCCLTKSPSKKGLK